jgi:hypothetical protein
MEKSHKNFKATRKIIKKVSGGMRDAYMYKFVYDATLWNNTNLFLGNMPRNTAIKMLAKCL